MPVDPHDHVPIYEQIVEHICGAVAAGVYRPGEMLPSIRGLALELIVNPNTVQRAYQELERQGLVNTRKGLGIFVAADGNASARSRTETAVRAKFSQGIHVGRAASIPQQRMRAIFRTAMEHGAKTPTQGDTTEEDQPSGARDQS